MPQTLPPKAQPADPLLTCLLLLVRANGGTLTHDAAISGLPIENGRLSPILFERAAKRGGMVSQIVNRPIGELNPSLLPAILLLKDDQACLLTKLDPENNQCEVVFPELGDAATTLPIETLNHRYLGHAIYARPKFRLDARIAKLDTQTTGHWFWSVIAENRKIYRDVLLAALVINLFAIAMPLFTMNVYDRVVPNNATDTLWVLSIGIMVVITADVILRTMRGYFIDLASNRADIKLSAYIMERVLGLKMAARPVSAGSFAANLRAFETIRDFISSATVVAFIDVPFAFIFLAVIAWIAWPLVLPFLIGFAVLLIYAMSVQRQMHHLSERTYQTGAQRNATLVEGLVGLETIKAIGAESNIQRKWEQSAVHLAQTSAQLRLISATTTNGAAWMQQFISIIVIIGGVYLIGAGQLSMGGLIACYMLSTRAMLPISQVASMLVQYHNAATSLASLNSMMEKEIERPETTNFISRQHFQGNIEFRDVTFSYPGTEIPALRNVSFKINAGEKIAILGRVGSGKTTIEKLILGLYTPNSGTILIDGIDLRQLDPAELRRNIGYVPQDIILFYGSLRDNLTLAAPLAEDNDIVQAAEIAGLSSFINSHPHGFSMLIGERGESLSGGQRQSVALARALINTPPILLLDEPTSAMDHSSEEDIKQRLLTFAHDKTMMIVTHRTSLLNVVDRIIVIDGGRIVADGPKTHVIQALKEGRIGKASS